MMQRSKFCATANVRGRGRCAWVLLATALTATISTATWTPSVAFADDLNPKLPNVLLLLDNSGSMAWELDTTTTTNCSTKPSRWSVLTQTLTGTITGLSCPTRLVRSNNCQAEANPGITTAHFPTGWEWPTYTGASPSVPAFAKDPINFQNKLASDAICSEGTGGWDQARDGLIDTFSRQVRFGMAQFDGSYKRETSSTGDFSYWFNSAASNWRDTPTAGFVTGNYGGAAVVPGIWEFGIRNPTARPWQGRLMGFGAPSAPVTDVEEQNRRIQLAILGTDPNTSTPSTAMMRDAYQFISFDDDSIANYPVAGSTFLLGPATDPAWTDPSKCRKTAVIFVTDGEPNQDMTRTSDADNVGGPYSPSKTRCYQNNGRCPFNDGALQSPVRTAYFAQKLYTERQVKVYVVGMSLDTATWTNGTVTQTKACTNITSADFAAGQICAWNAASKAWTYASGGVNVQACCELAETAILGGTGKAFFPSNVNQLKSEMGQILSDIAGGATSRTTPTVATALPQMPAGENSSAASYELLSSTRVALGDTLWRGNVERRRLVCDGTGADPTPAPITPSQGDDFAENIDAGRVNRRFFTVVAEEVTSGSGPRLMQTSTLRPAGFDHDGFTSYTFTQTNRVPIQNLMSSEVNAIYSEYHRALDIKDTLDQPRCGSLFGSANQLAKPCADALTKWYGGFDSGATFDRVLGRCPECSPLGAVFHSSPVVVGPPNEYVRDEAYRNQFSNWHRKRPTVSYVATLDGQLHAFVVAKNVSASAAAPAATDSNGDGEPDEPDYRFVPAPNSKSNNELWTFIPPTIMPKLFPNFNVHARLLDGQINVQNVVMKRTQAQAEAGTANWRTVAVVSGGLAAGYYFALDVTNPLNPKFLWQISDNGSGESLFGTSVPSAEIATIAITPAGSTVPEQRAVAILSGGSPTGAQPSIVKPRFGAGVSPGTKSYGLAGRPESIRGTIRDWGNMRERSVTVVDLATGEIIARFVGNALLSGGDPPQLVPSGGSIRGTSVGDLRIDAGFDSPMVGRPLAFATSPGDLVNRVYVGDADGTMWRLDLSDPNPSNWKSAIAWDGYGRTVSGVQVDLPTDGQPIELSPVLSVNEEGFAVVAFATGLQDNFSNPVPGMKNYAWSFTEQPLVGDPGFISKSGPISGKDYGTFELMTGGARATGPISLFNGGLYFSSFHPAGAVTACGTGNPRVWSIDFLSGAAKIDWNNDGTLDRFLTLNGGVVYGITANQRPSCISNTLVDVSSATGYPWLDGPSQALGTVSQTKYQLVMHTGQGVMTDDSLLGSNQMGAKTNSYHRDISAPTIRAEARDVAQTSVE